MARTSPVHYIAPSVISIIPNANGSANDLAVYVAKDARIKVYSPKAGIDMYNTSFREWTLRGLNRRLSDSEKPYTIYVRVSKTDQTNAYLVFAPKSMVGNEWKDKYPYVILEGLSGDTAGFPTGNYWYIRIGDVSLPSDNARSVVLDTGILGTEQYNTEWNMDPDDMPLRIELRCTDASGDDAGPTPYVNWNESVVLKASLFEGWANADIARFDHWEIARNSGDPDADASWPGESRAEAFAPTGEIMLSHLRGVNDDFNSAVAPVFTVFAWGYPDDDSSDSSSSEKELVVLTQASISILAETIEKCELVFSSDVMGYNPMSDSFSPSEGITVSIRATSQKGDVFMLTNTQRERIAVTAGYAAVGSDQWTELSFPGSADEIARAVVPVSAFYARKSINVRLLSNGNKELTTKTIAYVHDGEDSKEREWIFLRSATPITFGDASSEHPKPSLISGGEVNPTGAAGGEDTNKNQDGWVPEGWWDEQRGTEESVPYEYGSYRNFIHATGDGSGSGDSPDGHWGDFTDPTIWSHFGKDGNGIVSITKTYAISAQATTANDNTAPSDITRWRTGSPATTPAQPYLWAKEVTVYTDTTKNTTKYYRIGSRGDNGIDAQDVEFIYIRTKTTTAPVIADDSAYTDHNGHTYAGDDHLPRVVAEAGNTDIESNNSGDAEYPFECTDNPKGTDDTWKYEWVAKRSKGAPNAETGKRVWEKYSGSMKLWAVLAESITKRSELVEYVLSTDGVNPKSGEDWSTTKPTPAQGEYVLIRNTITWSDGSHTVLTSAERNPNDGSSGQDIVAGTTSVRYAVSDDNTTRPSTWYRYSDIVSQIVPGKWLWSRATTPYYKGSTSGESAGSSVTYNVSYIGTDGTSVVAQYSVNGTSNWHSTFADGDKYMRTSADGGTTWGAAIQIVGENGENGDYIDSKFGISSQLTTANVNTAPSDITTWSDAPIATTAAKPYLWCKQVSHTFSGGTEITGTPKYIRMTGEVGPQGANGRAFSGMTEYYKATNSSSPMSKPTSHTGWDSDPNLSHLTDKWNINHKYLWNMEELVYTESDGTTTTEYTTPQILAIFTEDGDPGSPGRGIDSIVNKYCVTNDSTVPAKEGQTGAPTWYNTPQVPAQGQYLWNYEVITWINPSGTTSTDVQLIGYAGADSTVPGPAGKDGYTVTCEPASLVINQNSSGTYDISSTNPAYFKPKVTKGNSTTNLVTAVTVSRNYCVKSSTTNIVTVGSWVDGSGLPITGVAAAAITNKYTQGYLVLSVTADSKTFTITIPVAVNYLGSYIIDVFEGKKTEMVNETKTAIEEDGTFVVNDAAYQQEKTAWGAAASWVSGVDTPAATVKNYNTRISNAETNISKVERIQGENISLASTDAWEQGSTNGEGAGKEYIEMNASPATNNGIKTTSTIGSNHTSRIRTVNLIPVTKDSYLVFNKDCGFQFFVLYFNANKKMILVGGNYGSGWKPMSDYTTGKYQITDGTVKYIALLLAKPNDAAITVADISNCGLSIINSPVSTSSEIEQTAAQIRLQVENCGVKIDEQKIQLYGGNVTIDESLKVPHVESFNQANGMITTIKGGLVTIQSTSSASMGLFGVNELGEIVLQLFDQSGKMVVNLGGTAGAKVRGSWGDHPMRYIGTIAPDTSTKAAMTANPVGSTPHNRACSEFCQMVLGYTDLGAGPVYYYPINSNSAVVGTDADAVIAMNNSYYDGAAPVSFATANEEKLAILNNTLIPNGWYIEENDGEFMEYRNPGGTTAWAVQAYRFIGGKLSEIKTIILTS